MERARPEFSVKVLDDSELSKPSVVSVNVGPVREVQWCGRSVRTAIWKTPVPDHTLRIAGVSCVGDEQADAAVHGGLYKAVYAYAVEDYRYWEHREDLRFEPGVFGENLTIIGVDLESVIVGEHWRIGTACLEVSQPRTSCFKLGLPVGDPTFPARFQAALRLGAYFRILNDGMVSRGDAIEITYRPEHGVTLGLMAQAILDKRKAAALLEIPNLPPHWRRQAEEASREANNRFRSV